MCVRHRALQRPHCAGLRTSQNDQEGHDRQNGAGSTAGTVTPGPGMRPHGQHPDENCGYDDQQDGDDTQTLSSLGAVSAAMFMRAAEQDAAAESGAAVELSLRHAICARARESVRWRTQGVTRDAAAAACRAMPAREDLCAPARRRRVSGTVWCAGSKEQCALHAHPRATCPTLLLQSTPSLRGRQRCHRQRAQPP